MGKKWWAHKLSALTYTKLSGLLKHPIGLSFRGSVEREDRSTWSGLSWKDLNIHRGDSSCSCQSSKVLPESPIHVFHNSWTASALLARSCLNSDTWWYHYSHILLSSDIVPCKHTRTKPESGKEHVGLACQPKLQSLKRKQGRDKYIMNERE